MASVSGTLKYGLNLGLFVRGAHGVAMIVDLHNIC